MFCTVHLHDAKRTLLTTGIFDYVLKARGNGLANYTPDLQNIQYQLYRQDSANTAIQPWSVYRRLIHEPQTTTGAPAVRWHTTTA